MAMTGPISPSTTTSRGQAFGRAAARDRFEEWASLVGLDNKGKAIEPAIATPTGGTPRWWCEITAATSVLSNNKWDYTIKLYDSLRTDTALADMPTTGTNAVKARNSWEYFNTATQQAAYTVNASGTSCDSIVGIRQIPVSTQRIRVVGYERVEDVSGGSTRQFRFIFSQRNDPRFYGEAT